jgi:putative aminopeptidase FrvX
VRALVRETLTGCGDITYDRLGSILCEKRGASASPRVVLDSHLDEVGFVVQKITDGGMLGFVPLGGWWGHVLLGQRVDVILQGEIVDGNPSVPGVIGSKPPHFLRSEERTRVLDLEQMYIDVGATSRKQVAELGISVGDPVVPHSEFVEFACRDILSCKAFDNRVGVGIVCETLLTLSKKKHPNTVVGVGAVQEEVGCRGAHTASAMARPDVALVLEGTPADDLPGFKDRQGVLGQGPQIRFQDPTAISNRRLVRLVQEVASDKGLAVQLAVRRSGGTDAKTIQSHSAGVPTVVIGVPARYIHTHVSLIHWKDYAAAAKLVLELVLRLDEKTVSALVDFG